MNEEQVNTEKLLDTTDCLEAIGVFRFWKNIFFIIAILCLLLLQVSFWLVNLDYIKPQECPLAAEAEQISTAAKQVTAEPNQPAEAAAEQDRPQKDFAFPSIRFGHLAWLIRVLNFVLILVAFLHCLTMMFSLKVSLLGRLGGINHIARAFFLSLIALIFLLPWQKFFGGVVFGAIYAPQELLRRCVGCFGKNCNVFCGVFYYLRFVGWGSFVLLLFIFSQIRSGRWTKTILRRLEVI
jgi:hypothetical protein